MPRMIKILIDEKIAKTAQRYKIDNNLHSYSEVFREWYPIPQEAGAKKRKQNSK